MEGETPPKETKERPYVKLINIPGFGGLHVPSATHGLRLGSFLGDAPTRVCRPTQADNSANPTQCPNHCQSHPIPQSLPPHPV